MDTPILIAVISAAAAVVAPAISFYLTKRKDREADWRKYNFELYKEFVFSLGGIVGTDSTPEGNRAFAKASNTLLLIGSNGVLTALYQFQDEIGVSNTSKSVARNDALLSKLVWEIREDLGIHEPQKRQTSLYTYGAQALSKRSRCCAALHKGQRRLRSELSFR